LLLALPSASLRIRVQPVGVVGAVLVLNRIIWASQMSPDVRPVGTLIVQLVRDEAESFSAPAPLKVIAI
jgi:hypothetical protein